MEMNLRDNDYKKKFYCVIDSKYYWVVSPTADGNCGLYAFACGLIDAITRNELILDSSLFEDFRKKVLNNISFCNLQKLLKNSSVNFDQFKVFLFKKASRQELSNMTMLLSNSLRQIGYEHYLKLLSKETQLITLEPEDKTLNRDGKYIGFEILISLANYFKIDINLIAYNPNLKNYYWAQTPYDKSKSLFTLVNINSHWNYLLPKEQTNGLAKFLPEEIVPTNASPIQANNKFKKNIARLPILLKMVTQELKKVFSLEALNNDRKTVSCSNKNLYFNSLNQNDKIIANTIETLRVNLDPEQLEISFEIFDFTEFEKDLITKTYVVDDQIDITAITLQNQALFDFFKCHYSLIAKRKPSSCMPSFFSYSTSEIPEVISTVSKAYNR